MVWQYFSNRRRVLALSWWGVCWGVLPRSHAADVPERAGQVDFVRGPSFVLDGSARQALRKGARVGSGQTLETGQDAEIHVLWDDGGYLAVRPESRVRIDAARMEGGADDSLLMTLVSGALRSITGWVGKFDQRSYRLGAGTVTIGIRGTDHEVSMLDSDDAAHGLQAGVHHWVNDGATTMHTAAGSLDVERGHAAWAHRDGSAPRAHAQGIPPGLQQRWRLVREALVNRHSQQVRQHIERRLREKNLLQRNERLEHALQRHQALQERLGRFRTGEGARTAPLHAGPTADERVPPRTARHPWRRHERE